MSNAIVPIVEGQSEVESVGGLLRRILHEELGAHHVQVAKPFRDKRYQVVREGELERAVKLATQTRPDSAAVLVLMDADDDCPAQLGPDLLARAARVKRLPVAVTIADRELEAWFLGAKESLRGVRGIRSDAAAPEAPESIRDAKGRLSLNMENRRYVEVDDQPALAAKLDLAQARGRCCSFDKLMRDIERLVKEIGKP